MGAARGAAGGDQEGGRVAWGRYGSTKQEAGGGGAKSRRELERGVQGAEGELEPRRSFNQGAGGSGDGACGTCERDERPVGLN